MADSFQSRPDTRASRLGQLGCVLAAMAFLHAATARGAYAEYGLTQGTLQVNGVTVTNGGRFELGYFASYNDTLGMGFFADKDYSTLRSAWTLFPYPRPSPILIGDPEDPGAWLDLPYSEDYPYSINDPGGLFYAWQINTLGVAAGTRFFVWAFSSLEPEISAGWSILSGTIAGASPFDVGWLAVDPGDPFGVNLIEIGGDSNVLYKSSSPSNALTPNSVDPSSGSADLQLFVAPAEPPSSGAGSYTARAPGGVRLLSGTNAVAGVALPPGAAAWESLSDREAKTAVAPLDSEQVLSALDNLMVASWEYRDLPGERHIGPMAQDFQAAFKLGDDNRTISTLDADGVALAAVQALIAQIEERKARLAAQDRRLESLERELRELGGRL